MTANIFFIPSDVPFAPVLADHLLRRAGDDPLELARMRVLLPSRRACRSMREILLDRSGGRPLLLPRLQPLGDVDDEELTLSADDALAREILALPPAMPPRRRLILLAKAIMLKDNAPASFDQALALAGDLGRLLDQMRTGGIPMTALDALVEGDNARHWEITTKFLKILSEVWPAILATEGMIDAADRRDRLLRLAAAHWRVDPPRDPVIAAGSTGTIPAVAELLAAIAGSPQGSLILPGLDRDMDEDSWTAIEPSHPQAGLKTLLERLGVARQDVAPLDGIVPHSPRLLLAREATRPAATSDRWNTLDAKASALKDALQGVTRCDCADIEEEARVIALVFRETLEAPGRTAALVTPDRELARRVAGVCRRWGLEIDDSAGRPLKETPAGHFLRLVAQACASRVAPVDLLALLRHRFCAPGQTDRAGVAALEKHALRGPKPSPGFAGLRGRLDEVSRERPERTRGLAPAYHLLDRLEPAMTQMLQLGETGPHPASLWLDAHIRTAEALGPRDADGASLLWQDAAGEAAAALLTDLAGQGDILPAQTAPEWGATLARVMGFETVRPRYGTHARLAILGQLEARMLAADVIVMGGLNEGVWPVGTGHDPFLSPPMRQRVGLPAPDEAVGLAAHDFVQGFCAGRVVLTRALRQGGAPTTPSRWLQRLDTVLRAADPDLGVAAGDWTGMARIMDRPNRVQPFPRPAPRPPLSARPRRLPVTAIAGWANDPYGLYAKYILRLRPLEPLEKSPDAAARGSFLHAVLNDFVAAHRDALPPNAATILHDLGAAHLGRLASDVGFWIYWMPRFARIVDWIVGHEAAWRQGAHNIDVEARGETVLATPGGPFTLTARADRIDQLAGGGVAIIDYKTGSGWKKSGMTDGSAPQLPLEGLILERGGFGGRARGVSGPVRYLGYWKLTGGAQEGDAEAQEGDDAAAAIAASLAGLENLIAAYDDPMMPYLSLPDPRRKPRFQDYAHLARVQEWSVAEGDDE